MLSTPDINAIKKYIPEAGVVELGAGDGIWLDALLKAKIDAVGIDINPKHPKVIKGDHTLAAKKYADRMLLVVWPPIGNAVGHWVREASWPVIALVGQPQRYNAEMATIGTYDLVHESFLEDGDKGHNKLMIYKYNR